MNTKIITVTSQKGGVAKTTTATALAHGLARRGDQAVMLADFDPQGHAAISLGYDPAPDNIKLEFDLLGNASQRRAQYEWLKGLEETTLSAVMQALFECNAPDEFQAKYRGLP